MAKEVEIVMVFMELDNLAIKKHIIGNSSIEVVLDNSVDLAIEEISNSFVSTTWVFGLVWTSLASFSLNTLFCPVFSLLSWLSVSFLKFFLLVFIFNVSQSLLIFNSYSPIAIHFSTVFFEAIVLNFYSSFVLFFKMFLKEIVFFTL